MRSATGQIIRSIGLLIEVVCILWYSMLARRGNVPRKPGAISQADLLKLAMVGLVIWLVGITMSYWPRRPAKPTQRME
jgi:hypothetical protein